MIDDTICAVATAHGVGGIAIVRVSGEEALNIALKLTNKKSLTPRYATLSTLKDSNNQILDEAIVIYFKAPNSYTKEDVVEFQCHGGLMVANLVIKEILKLGARVAKPGEFTKRAFLNGRIDLSKAEATMSLIEAKSEDAALILARQLKGELKEFVDELREKLVEILAFIEVNIDYAEEDLPNSLQDEIKQKLSFISNKLEKSLNISKSRVGLIDGFKVAIVGKPNVGKSSLLNSLLSYDRAIISKIAGTTRDTIEESLKIGSHLVKIVDTAGVRDSKDDIEKIGIQRSLDAIKDAQIIIALFDQSRAVDDSDMKILNILNQYRDKKKIFVLLNKNDLESKFDKKKLTNFTPISTNTKTSQKIVLNLLKEYLDTQNLDQDIMLISQNQIGAVQETLNAIAEAKTNMDENELELFAFNINEAIESITKITKPFQRDEILDKMFSSFCLGK